MTRTERDDSTVRLFVAFELSASKWKLAFSRELAAAPRIRDVVAGDLEAVKREIAEAKERLGLQPDTPVMSCYEAGRDGFWLHRWLLREGIENLVIDPASIEVERRRRKRKTDRIDATKLLVRLVRHAWGEKVWSVVRVPTEEDEDRRRLHRERERLVHECVQHQARIRSLLATQGIRPDAIVPEALDQIRPSDQASLPPHLRRELEREVDRLSLIRRQIKAVEVEIKDLMKDGTPVAEKTRQLARVKGIGLVGAQVLTLEFFGWREFRNGRQVGALAGLTGTPHQSGTLDHEQGISKAGNSRIRALMTELAWGWLRFQPASTLSRWFQARFGGGSGRMRRVGIVALARKLLVALWRFVDQGVIPEGAMIRPA